MAIAPNCNCSGVPHICPFGTLKHTCAIREGQNGQRWGAPEQLRRKLKIQHRISISGKAKVCPDYYSFVLLQKVVAYLEFSAILVIIVV